MSAKMSAEHGPASTTPKPLSLPWDDIRIAQAAELWADPDLSTGDIARRLGCSVGAFAGLSTRHRDRFPRRQRKLVVEAATLEDAVRLWAEGLPSDEIARRIGLEDAMSLRTLRQRHPARFPKRSAGGLPGVAAPPAARPVPVAKPAPKPAPVAEVEDVDPGAESEARPASAEAFRPLRGVAPVLVFECSGCSWPVHEAGDPLRSTARHFCGAPKGTGPYCETHRVMAVRTTPAMVFSRRRPLRMGGSV